MPHHNLCKPILGTHTSCPQTRQHYEAKLDLQMSWSFSEFLKVWSDVMFREVEWSQQNYDVWSHSLPHTSFKQLLGIFVGLKCTALLCRWTDSYTFLTALHTANSKSVITYITSSNVQLICWKLFYSLPPFFTHQNKYEGHSLCKFLWLKEGMYWWQTMKCLPEYSKCFINISLLSTAQETELILGGHDNRARAK